jgi:hypothetical protein
MVLDLEYSVLIPVKVKWKKTYLYHLTFKYTNHRSPLSYQ